jgi:hypothetical protein
MSHASRIIHKPHLETLYSVRDNYLYWTGKEDFFSYDELDAATFETEDEAEEACGHLPYVTIEAFQRVSSRPKIVTNICVPVPVDTLQDIRDWICHWQFDKSEGRPPSGGSLDTVRDLLESALDARRVFPVQSADAPRTFASAGGEQ